MPTKKPTHGGARHGAGRPALDPSQRRVTIHPTVAPGTLDRIAALSLMWADPDGPLSSGEVLDRALRLAHPDDPDE